MKKFFFAVVAFMFSLSAFAADTIKGNDPLANNKPTIVGHSVIAKYKPESGILHYVTSFNGTPRQMVDANGSQGNELSVHFGQNKAFNVSNGWYYHLGRVSVICDPVTGTTTIQVHGYNGVDQQVDGCAFHAVANGL